MGFVGPHVQARLILRSFRTAAKRLPGGVGRENGEAAFVADDGLAVDQHERTASTVRAATICGKRFEKSLPFLVSSCTRPSARRAIMRNSSCLIS